MSMSLSLSLLLLLSLYAIIASSCVLVKSNSCCFCFNISLVDFADFDVMAPIGQSNVLSTALPRKKIRILGK